MKPIFTISANDAYLARSCKVLPHDAYLAKFLQMTLILQVAIFFEYDAYFARPCETLAKDFNLAISCKSLPYYAYLARSRKILANDAYLARFSQDLKR